MMAALKAGEFEKALQHARAGQWHKLWRKSRIFFFNDHNGY